MINIPTRVLLSSDPASETKNEPSHALVVMVRRAEPAWYLVDVHFDSTLQRWKPPGMTLLDLAANEACFSKSQPSS
jgi:hypothetical protein